ncbi:MAG: MFS transporter, partial [Candidatus Lokiarchaeota archaeon]|nr:MFS transporter [Candidatus Lokiarchaeota archaeon]MBD3340624.1 MFS transporter [Candidatus Lokiarchaeota archaeon]
MKRKLTLYLIIFGFFLKEFSRNLLLPNLIVISHHFFGEDKFEAVEMGLLVTVIMASSAIACLLFGIIADRTTRKVSAVIALVFWSSGLLISAFTPNYLLLLLGCSLLGFGSGGYIPVAQAVIGDAAPRERIGHYYGLSSISNFLGMMSGLLIASIFSPFWQIPYFIGGIFLICFLLVYGIRGANYQVGLNDMHQLQSQNDLEKEISYDYHITWDKFKKMITNKTNFLIFIEGIFSIFGMAIIFFSLYPYLIEGPAHITPLVASLMLILFISPTQLLGIYIWGRIGDHYSPKHPKIRIKLIVMSFLITTPYFMMLFWVQGSPAESTNTLLKALTNRGILFFLILFMIGSFFLGMYDSNQ